MCKISVIIPIYNVEQYIKQALDSVVNQTFNDFEAIMVDDGSTDSSGKIADAYAKKYPCFRIIHQENQGVSVARNTGIRAAKGKFICFLDPDDWYEPNVLQDFFNAVTEDIDLVCCNFSHYGFEDTVPDTSYGKGELTYYPAGLPYIFHDFGFPVWNKMFRTDIIRKKNVYFDRTFRSGSDVLFNSSYFVNARKVCVIKKVLYNYRYRETAITKQKKIMNHFEHILRRHSVLLDYIDSFDDIKVVLQKHNTALFFLAVQNAVFDQFLFCDNLEYNLQCTLPARKMLIKHQLPAFLRIAVLLILKCVGKYEQTGELMHLARGVKMFWLNKTAFDVKKWQYVSRKKLESVSIIEEKT